MKSKDELLKELSEKVIKIRENFKENDRIEDFWNITKEELLTKPKEKSFRLVYSVGSWKKFYYYISNCGRVIVVKTEEVPKKEITKLKGFEYCFIKIKNGYLNDGECSFPEVKLTNTTDIYKFMIEAGWLEENCGKENAEKIVEYNIKSGEYINDRLEVHHIDNNPSNNSVNNLIWLPKSIHQRVHSN